MLHTLALVAAISGPPTPEQYYARALDTMNALPQPAQVTYDIDMHAIGAEIGTSCRSASGRHGMAFEVGWGSGMSHALHVHARYRLAGDEAEFEQRDGTYCTDDIALFKPEWASVDDWVRYGLSGAPPDRPNVQPPSSPAPAALHTIASVRAIAPDAYRIYDMGAAPCPNGSDGHALHLVARSDPDGHPLTDVVIDRNTMRFCSMRLRLLASTVMGTGAKGDAVLDFGENGTYWSVVHEHAMLSLRLLGASLKNMGFDATFSNQPKE